QIRDDFDKNVRILSIEPDTIYFNMSEHVTKKVPVTGDFSLSFKDEFRQYAPVQFSPDSVTIVGSQEHVAKVNSVSLSPKKYENIDETIEDISTVSNIIANPSKIRYKIPVERCTEGTVSVAVKTVNVPRGSKLILLPARVEIKYVVPLKDFASVSTTDFFAEVDFNDTKTSLSRYVKVKAVQYPSSVFDIRMEPSFVEFLIQK
ncbi:MAG: hypothetical protein LBK96_00020, partial [Prevotellaceae bacterium]|nr:hypothetical protein [Prevotellaceae bacterium]